MLTPQSRSAALELSLSYGWTCSILVLFSNICFVDYEVTELNNFSRFLLEIAKNTNAISDQCMHSLPTSTGQQEQDLQQHLDFLEEANRDVLSASSACFNFSTYSIVAVLLISCLRRQPQPFSPSTWERIQLCVSIWLLTDHFPTNLSNSF